MKKHLNQILGSIFLAAMLGFLGYKLVKARDIMSDSQHTTIMVVVVVFVIFVIFMVRKIIKD